MDLRAQTRLIEDLIAPYWSTDPSKRADLWLKFMRDELLYIPDPPMIPCVASMASYRDTAIRSSHGVGKTTFGANIMLTALTLTPELLIMQLSPTWRQVNNIFWNEIRKWSRNSRLFHALFDIADKSPSITSRADPFKWHAIGMASNMPGKVEGKHSRRVLLVADEVKAIPDEMIEAVQGALTSELMFRLYLSTPSTPGGRFTAFYKAFTRNRHRWATFRIRASDSPRVNPKWVEMMAEEYGIESQAYLARVEAEFPEASGDILIPLQAAESMYRDDIPEERIRGAIALGVDVARFGDDETVISEWRGKTMIGMYPIKTKTEKLRITETCKAVKQIISKSSIVRAVAVDDIGVGGGVTDLLSDPESDYYVGDAIAVYPVTVSKKPRNENKFASLGDEIVWTFAREVVEGEVATTVDDEKLVYQLSSFKLSYDVKERIKVIWPEVKKERSADEKSPDRADATWLGWYASTRLMAQGVTEIAQPAEVKRRDRDDEEGEFDEDAPLTAGFIKKTF